MNTNTLFYIGKPDYYLGVAMADDLIELQSVVKAALFQKRTVIYVDYQPNKAIVSDLQDLQGKDVSIVEINQDKRSFANYSGHLDLVSVNENLNLIELSVQRS